MVALTKLDRSDKAICITVVILVLLIGLVIGRDAETETTNRAPQLVYLAPAGALVQNLYLIDPITLTNPVQLTQSQQGIVGYDVSADGNNIVYTEIVYSEDASDETTQFYLLNIPTRTTRLLYSCKVVCINLALRPDGSMIAWQQINLDDVVGNAPSPPRVWLYDIGANSARPLFSDNQQLGYSPRWSPDGTQLAVYNPALSEIVIHNFTTNLNTTIQAPDGEFGTFSPDGTWLYYPTVILLEGKYGAVRLNFVELASGQKKTLVADNDAISEAEAAWRTDSLSLIVARQPPIRQLMTGSDLYEVNLETGKADLLISNESNSQSDLLVSPDNSMLLFQRVALGEAAPRPRLWLYHFSDKTLYSLPEDATLAKWVR